MLLPNPWQVTLASLIVVSALTQDSRASIVVTFTGQLTSVSPSGPVDAISQYLAVGDTFFGSFTYNESAVGTSVGTINNVGEWKEYNGAVTA
jgi:hypothetical protein